MTPTSAHKPTLLLGHLTQLLNMFLLATKQHLVFDTLFIGILKLHSYLVIKEQGYHPPQLPEATDGEGAHVRVRETVVQKF